MSILIAGIDMPTKGNPITVLIYPDGTAEWEAQNKVGTASGWISVKDRLPEDGVEVLCWLLTDAGDCYVSEGRYETIFKMWDFLDSEYALSRHVTHWMPLPEPPKINY